MCTVSAAARCGAAAVVLLTLAALSPVARAQTPPVVAPSPSLASLLPKLRWDPERLGPLLIVAPGETQVRQRVYRKNFQVMSEPAAKIPPPGDDGYRLADLAAPFDRQVVRCGSLHVFAPSKMSVLNTKTLPKPSAFLGLPPQDAFRALLATLTPAQWRQLASPTGLGRADLTDEQRGVWSILFPAQMLVDQVSNGTASVGSLPMTEAQRSQIKLHMSQAMQVMVHWKRENGGQLGVGVGLTPSKSGEPELYLNWDSLEPPLGTVFGQQLRQEVPAALKPGDLPFDWNALDVTVSLSNAPTVGDLVKRIAKTTRIELHCDPRYRARPVYVRGKDARAGDILKALCRGLTATWRKVGEDAVWVLTDDRAGLGARHADLAEWIAACTTLQTAWLAQVSEKLDAVRPAQYLTFRGGDPHLPDAVLLQKLQPPATPPFPDKYNTIETGSGASVSLAELPKETQTAIQKVRDEIRSSPEYANAEPLPKIDVDLRPRVTALIPGIGWTATPFGVTELHKPFGRYRMVVNPSPQSLPTPRYQLTTDMTTRAVTVPLPGEGEVTALLDRVQASGFNEVWLATPTDDPSTQERLARAIAAAKMRGLPVRAVVSGFRALKADEVAVDRNVRGETGTAVLRRIARQPALGPLPPNVGVMQGQLRESERQEAERQAADGEWLTPTAETAQARAPSLAAIAKTPGLAGLVVRELVPPGYDFYLLKFGSYGAMQTQGGDLGYTPARRLAFLRETGVDPLDISALGDTPPNSTGQYWGAPPSLALPFFPSLPLPSRFSKVRASASAAAEKPADGITTRWLAHRAEAGYEASAELLKAVLERAGAVPLLATWKPNIATAGGEFAGGEYRLVENAAELKRKMPSFPDERPWPRDLAGQRKWVHEGARQVLSLAEWMPGMTEASGLLPGMDFSISMALKNATTTHDGVVVDLSRLSLPGALDVLRRWELAPASEPNQAKKP